MKFRWKLIILLLSIVFFISLFKLPAVETSKKVLEVSERPHKIEIVKLVNQDILKDFDTGIGFFSILFKARAANLGEKIDEGRKYKDAQSLMKSFRTLRFLERISGKESSKVTSKELLNEISLISKDRRDPELLRKVALLWKDPKFGNSSNEKKYLNFAAEAENIDHSKVCRVEVFNKTSYFDVLLYINSTYIKTLSPGEKTSEKVLAGYIKLLAQDEQGYAWGPRDILLETGETFRWKLYE